MKQLTCEMCGGTDLIKQDGVFVCQSCGTKYSVEEARKMMIEGTVDVSGSTVRVDRSESVAALLKRVFMALEDREWDKADDFCEQVLNQDPENAQAYLGKLMAELQVSKKEKLKDCEEPFDELGNFEKTIRFGNMQLREELSGYISLIKERNVIESNAFEQKVKLVTATFLNEEKKEVLKTWEKLTGIRDSIERLSSRRDSLGIFAGKDKKRIDEELESIESQENAITRKIAWMVYELKFIKESKLDSVLESYITDRNTREHIVDNVIGVLKSFVHSLEEENRKDDSEYYGMSFEEAVWLYATDQKLARKIDEAMKDSISNNGLNHFVSEMGYDINEMDKRLADRFADSNYPIEIDEWESYISHCRTLEIIDPDRVEVSVNGLQQHFKINENTAEALFENMIKRGLIGAISGKTLN